MNKKSISVFFPAYNEEEIIEMTVRKTIPILQEVSDDFEILVINDASTDRTGEIAEALAAEYDFVRVIHHETNKGLGGGLKTGFSSARKELILYSDADLPFDMAELKHALRVMEITGADIVSAFRHDRVNEGMLRVVYTFFYNNLIRVMFGLRVKDVNFSFKLVKRKVFEKVVLKSEGSFIDAELLIKCEKFGFKIAQFGVDYLPRTKGTSTLASPRVILGIISEMLKLRKELKSIKPEDALNGAMSAKKTDGNYTYGKHFGCFSGLQSRRLH